MKKTLQTKAQLLAIFALCLFSFSSCNDKEILPSPPSAEVKTNSHTIPLNQALASLKSFMNESTGNETRATTDNRRVKEVFTIKYQTIATRASIPNKLDCENLLYIANFENNQGFAVLAADDRIKDEVLAITQHGALPDSSIYLAMQQFASQRPIIKGYPTTGPGFVKVPEYPGEIFMNPNTVNLADNEENDTLVGNFFLDDFGAVNEYGYPIEPPTKTLKTIIDQPETLVGFLCSAYALEEINKNPGTNIWKEENGVGNGGAHRPGGGTTNPGIAPEDNTGGSAYSKQETINSEWRDVKETTSLLSDFCYWNQREPFNNLYPEVRRFIIFGHKRKAPAGCFPLAIAKIMARFEYPTTFSYKQYPVDWNSLKSDFMSSKGSESAAALLRGISHGCRSWYFYSGTFTFPKKALSFMRSCGYQNVQKSSYDFSKVKKMIDNGKPLIIYGAPGINIFKSHCWNIDGYKMKVRTVTTKYYSGNVVVKTTEHPDTCKMIHCDFGWSGNNNGYYVSGIFNLNSSDIELDNPNSPKDKTKYTKFIHVVTYEKP